MLSQHCRALIWTSRSYEDCREGDAAYLTAAEPFFVTAIPFTFDIACMSYEERIYNALVQGTPTSPRGLPAPLAALVVAQSKHETGNYTSNAFRTANNAFGYSYVPGGVWQKGAGLIADNGKPVAKYASVEDSAREIVDWIYRRVREGIFPVNLDGITTPEQYGALLKQAGYYGDSLANYVGGLKRWFSDLGSFAKANQGPVVVLAVVVLAVVFRKQLGFR